jgi:hypothetical protein
VLRPIQRQSGQILSPQNDLQFIEVGDTNPAAHSHALDRSRLLEDKPSRIGCNRNANSRQAPAAW